MSRRNVVDEVLDESERRVLTGEPEPGVHGCLRCGRTEGVQSFTVRNPLQPNPRHRPTMYDWETADTRERGSYLSQLVCPCCSFDTCQHVPRLECQTCLRPIGPPGYWATRCETDGVHPARVPA